MSQGLPSADRCRWKHFWFAVPRLGYQDAVRRKRTREGSTLMSLLWLLLIILIVLALLGFIGRGRVY